MLLPVGLFAALCAAVRAQSPCIGTMVGPWVPAASTTSAEATASEATASSACALDGAVLLASVADMSSSVFYAAVRMRTLGGIVQASTTLRRATPDGSCIVVAGALCVFVFV